jgi:hypothetical protein
MVHISLRKNMCVAVSQLYPTFLRHKRLGRDIEHRWPTKYN